MTALQLVAMDAKGGVDPASTAAVKTEFEKGILADMLAERISRQEYAEKLIQGPQQGSAVQGGVNVVAADGAGAPVQGVGKEQPQITMPELRRKQNRYKLLLKQFEKNPEYAE